MFPYVGEIKRRAVHIFHAHCSHRECPATGIGVGILRENFPHSNVRVCVCKMCVHEYPNLSRRPVQQYGMKQCYRDDQAWKIKHFLSLYSFMRNCYL